MVCSRRVKVLVQVCRRRRTKVPLDGRRRVPLLSHHDPRPQTSTRGGGRGATGSPYHTVEGPLLSGRPGVTTRDGRFRSVTMVVEVVVGVDPGVRGWVDPTKTPSAAVRVRRPRSVGGDSERRTSELRSTPPVVLPHPWDRPGEGWSGELFPVCDRSAPAPRPRNPDPHRGPGVGRVDILPEKSVLYHHLK